MILKLLVSGLVLAGAFVAVDKSPPQDEKEMEKMAEMMAMFEKAATPGEQHKGLGTLVGKWDQQCKFAMPGFPPSETKGTAEYRSILGGRYVVCDNSSTMMVPGADGKLHEKPFAGFQILGYDNVLKQYQQVWCDSFSTGIFTLTGTADAMGKKITYEGIAKDAMTPEGRPWKMVVNVESDDKHMIELWDTSDGKTLSQMGTITATRRK